MALPRCKRLLQKIEGPARGRAGPIGIGHSQWRFSANRPAARRGGAARAEHAIVASANGRIREVKQALWSDERAFREARAARLGRGRVGVSQAQLGAARASAITYFVQCPLPPATASRKSSSHRRSPTRSSESTAHCLTMAAQLRPSKMPGRFRRYWTKHAPPKRVLVAKLAQHRKEHGC